MPSHDISDSERCRPEEPLRREILHRALSSREHNVGDDVIEWVASETVGYRRADLFNVVNSAVNRAILDCITEDNHIDHDNGCITEDNLINAYEKIDSDPTYSARTLRKGIKKTLPRGELPKNIEKEFPRDGGE